MTDAPVKWRYGTQLRSGEWLWPRGLWEYDVGKAKAAALRTFPHADVVGIEPVAEGERFAGRLIHEAGKGWRLSMAAAEPGRVVAGPIGGSMADADPPARRWWDRD